MTKKFYLIVLMALMVIAGFAQETGDVIYVYQKDGDIRSFLRSEVTEFYYGYEDEQGVTHNDVQMQWIVMGDSICKIPLANIDSVSFVTPATVYQPDVIRIEQGLMDYVVSSDMETSTIVLLANTPAALIPKAGDKLVTLEMNEKFEGGFAGVVSEVTKGTDFITIICDDVELEDIFETYYNTVIAESRSEEESASPRRARRSNDLEFTWEMPTISYVIGAEYTKEVKKIDDLVWKLGTKGEVSLTPTVKLKNSLIVSKGRGKQYQGYINANFELKETMSFYGGLEWSKDFGLNVFKKPIAPLCYFYIKPGVFVKAALTASLNAGWTQVVNTTIHYDYNNKRTDQPLKMRAETKKPTNNYGMEALIDGSISSGMFMEIGVFALKEKWDNLAWRGELGAELVGHLVLYNNDIKNASSETRLYEILKSSGIECNYIYNGGFQAKIGKKQWNFPFGPAATAPVERWDLVPTFDQMEFTQCYSPRTSADARANLTGKCVMPITVGLLVKDDKGVTVDNWNADGQYQNGGRTISTRFTGLKEDTNYTLHPKLVFLDFDLLASPSADLERDLFPVRIISFEQTGSHYSKQQGYEYDGRNYFYKFNATTTVELSEGAQNVKDWGYVYHDIYGEYKKISCANLGSNPYSDQRYAYYYNDTHRTVELCPYVQYTGETEIQKGKPKIYEVDYTHKASSVCPDSNHPHLIDLGLPSGTLWACCNVGASEPEDQGYEFMWGTTKPIPDEAYYETKYDDHDYEVGGWDDFIYYHDESSTTKWNWNFGDVTNGEYYNMEFLLKLFNRDLLGTKAELDIARTPEDAANAYTGLQMPSREQMQELLDNCSLTAYYDGHPSESVSFMFTGPSGRSILLPSNYRSRTFECCWIGSKAAAPITTSEIYTYRAGYWTSTFDYEEGSVWYLAPQYDYSSGGKVDKYTHIFTPSQTTERITHDFMRDGLFSYSSFNDHGKIRPVTKKK